MGGQGGEGSLNVHKRRKKDKSMKIDIHAECDCVSFAAREGIKLRACTAFVTRSPCFSCLPVLLGTGIRRIVYVGRIFNKKVQSSEETATRMYDLARVYGVELVEDAPFEPPELAKIRRTESGDAYKSRSLPDRPEILRACGRAAP